MRAYSVSGFAELEDPSRIRNANEMMIQLGALRKAMDKDIEMGVSFVPALSP